MKPFNFFKTVPPQQQRSFFQWIRVSLLLCVVLVLCLSLATAKLMYDYYRAARLYRTLQGQVAGFDSMIATKHNQTQECNLLSEQQALLKKMYDHPVNPYLYITEVYNSIGPEIDLQVITVDRNRLVTVEGIASDLYLIDNVVKKMMTSFLFSNVHIEAINRVYTNAEKNFLLKFVIKSECAL